MSNVESDQADKVRKWQQITVISPYWMIVVLHLFVTELHGRRQPLLTGVALLKGGFWTIAELRRAIVRPDAAR